MRSSSSSSQQRRPGSSVPPRTCTNSEKAKLPRPDYQEFVDSLVFNNGGVAGGCYKPLMYTLTLPEIHEVFAHFGMSMQLFTDDTQESCLECRFSGNGCSFSF
jgi:hypothetical protein